MGSYAYLFKTDGTAIPENKREEFVERIEKLFNAGGMMDLEQIKLYGRTVTTMRKAQMSEEGIRFNYNYFEDDWWETAGYDPKRGEVYSGKIGWGEFQMVMIAAYTLEGVYSKGISAVMMDGEPFESWSSVAWINYLFNTQYHLKNFDPWKLFEALHETGEGGSYPLFFGERGYLFIGTCETFAVINGTEQMINRFEKEEKGEAEESAFKSMKESIQYLQKYKNDNQCETLINLLWGLYETSDTEKYIVEIQDPVQQLLVHQIYLSDAPAVAVKTIAEIYQKDFWELWGEVKENVRRKRQWTYGNIGYYILPVSTCKLFHITPDDMIPYWTENGDIEFSKGLQNWFKKLKKRYARIMATEFVIEKPLLYIMELMQEANDNYYSIYAFTEFVEETIENLYDKRYLSLWKLYEEMLRDQGMKKAGNVLFVSDGPEYEKEGIHYFGTLSKRRLSESWDFMPAEKKNNKARVTLRRYMALVANRELRREVLGF